MLARIVLSLVLCSLLGCGSHSRAPDDRDAQSRYGTYTVKRGDTLYSIAFRSGMDYRKVAVANAIVAPYTIYPGQIIYLNEVVPSAPIRVSPAVPESRQMPPPSVMPVPPPIPVSAPVRVYGSTPVYATPTPAPVVKDPAVPSPPEVNPVAPIVTAPTAPLAVPPPAPPPSPDVARAEVRKQVEADAFVGDKVGVWLWPTSGPVIRGYSESVHKGIDIGGARGDPIVAVAAGKVVYAGTGIVGFGELLIVKHNEEYLSAYGHNDRLLVTEGQAVTAGQIIAEKGNSGTDTVQLHFEIRKEGKPIDPQRVLPQR